MKIKDIVKESGLLYDRVLTQDLTLPYNMDTIRIQPNDTSSGTLINQKLQFLYNNFLYLYKNTQVLSNIIPVSSYFTSIIGVTANSNKLNIYKQKNTSQFTYLSADSLYVNMDFTKSILFVSNNDNNNDYIFCGYKGNINAFNVSKDATIIKNVFSTNQIEAPYNVNFLNIKSIVKYNNNIFVLDNLNNILVKYDASGFTTDNNITNEQLIYLNSIGGFGTTTTKTEFNNPQSIACYNNSLYVLDSGNSCVKQFDVNLNWKQTFRLTRDFLNVYPVDIKIDSFGKAYVLTDKNKIFKYDIYFQNYEIIDLTNIKTGDETFIQLSFSEYDSNIFYVISDKNVYKKLVNNPTQLVGKYLFYLYNYNTAENITCFSSASCIDGDKNLVFSTNNSKGKIGYFYDNLNLFDILSINNFDVYTLHDILLSEQEYIQNWVFNKSISKLLVNLIRLKDQIVGKFLAQRDSYGNIAFSGTRYLTPNEIESVTIKQDINYFIGCNEYVSCAIVNRVLENIYNIQVDLASILNSDITNIPDLDKTLILN
jgi:hypothetical protein